MYCIVVSLPLSLVKLSMTWRVIGFSLEDAAAICFLEQLDTSRTLWLLDKMKNEISYIYESIKLHNLHEVSLICLFYILLLHQSKP